MGKKILIASLPLLLLASCSQKDALQGDSLSSGDEEGSSFRGDQVDGGMATFSASSLPSTPSKEEKETKISGHAFLYYNVYKDEEDNFVLKDDTSYIRNYTLVFGLLFAKGLARAYDISDGKDGFELCQDFYGGNETQSYSVWRGFEIAIDKTLSSHHYDENIGKIVHWC